MAYFQDVGFSKWSNFKRAYFQDVTFSKWRIYKMADIPADFQLEAVSLRCKSAGGTCQTRAMHSAGGQAAEATRAVLPQVDLHVRPLLPLLLLPHLLLPLLLLLHLLLPLVSAQVATGAVENLSTWPRPHLPAVPDFSFSFV